MADPANVVNESCVQLKAFDCAAVAFDRTPTVGLEEALKQHAANEKKCVEGGGGTCTQIIDVDGNGVLDVIAGDLTEAACVVHGNCNDGYAHDGTHDVGTCSDGTPNLTRAQCELGFCSDGSSPLSEVDCLARGYCSDQKVETKAACVSGCYRTDTGLGADAVPMALVPGRATQAECDPRRDGSERWEPRHWIPRSWYPRTWTHLNDQRAACLAPGTCSDDGSVDDGTVDGVEHAIGARCTFGPWDRTLDPPSPLRGDPTTQVTCEGPGATGNTWDAAAPPGLRCVGPSGVRGRPVNTVWHQLETGKDSWRQPEVQWVRAGAPWTFCANEFEPCDCPGGLVRFGVEDSWAMQQSGVVDLRLASETGPWQTLTVATGDYAAGAAVEQANGARGRVKAAVTSGATVKVTVSEGAFSADGGAVNIGGVAVAVSAFGATEPTLYPNPIECSDVVWGSDPAPGRAKHCECRREPTELDCVGTTGNTWTEGGSTTTAILADSASSVDGFYNGKVLRLTRGPGMGQSATITKYSGATKVATFAAMATASARGTRYLLSYAPHAGLLVGSTTADVTLADTASAVNDHYNGKMIWFTHGTGMGQRIRILDYVGATRVAKFIVPGQIHQALKLAGDTTTSYLVEMTPPTFASKGACEGAKRSNVWVPFNTWTPTAAWTPSVGIGDSDLDCFFVPRNATRVAQRECEEGFYCVGGVRHMCPGGTYGTEKGLSGHIDHGFNRAGPLYHAPNSKCSGWCPAGRFCPPGPKDPFLPEFECPPGTYSNRGSIACVPCPWPPTLTDDERRGMLRRQPCRDRRSCCNMA
jgi:hypothetical protein